MFNFDFPALFHSLIGKYLRNEGVRISPELVEKKPDLLPGKGVWGTVHQVLDYDTRVALSEYTRQKACDPLSVPFISSFAVKLPRTAPTEYEAWIHGLGKGNAVHLKRLGEQDARRVVEVLHRNVEDGALKALPDLSTLKREPTPRPQEPARFCKPLSP